MEEFNMKFTNTLELSNTEDTIIVALTLRSPVVTICTTTLNSVYVCFLPISEQTAITSLHSII